MAAQQIPATNSEEVVTLTAVGDGSQEGSHYETIIEWLPASLGEPNRFHVKIFPANQLDPKQPSPACYDFRIYKGDKFLLPQDSHLTCNERINQDFSQDYEFVFLDEGSYVISLAQINQEGETIEIPIQVTPEFPVGIAASLVTAAGALFAVTYSRIRTA